MKKFSLIIIIVTLIFIVSFIVFKKDTPMPVIDETPTVVVNELAQQEGLPEVVEAKRQAIYRAALTKDYVKLANEATSADNFNYSFGGEFEGGFAGFMEYVAKEEGRSAFEIIPMLLKLPYALNSNSIQGDIYTWPSVFTVESSKWTSEDISMMRTFLTDEEIENYRQFGGYIYYRLGITSKGEWIFYLAGD